MRNRTKKRKNDKLYTDTHSKNKLQLQICDFKISLFGKDVLSIIESYNPEGFHLWDEQNRKLMKEYHEQLYWDDDEKSLMSKKLSNKMFNYPDNGFVKAWFHYRLSTIYTQQIYYNEISTGVYEATEFMCSTNY